MAIDLVTQDITNLSSSSAAATLNANFNAVEVALQSALDRLGGTNNEMEHDLDLDGHDLLNVKTINADDFTVGGSNITNALSAVDAAVASALNAVDDVNDSLAKAEVFANRSEAAFAAIGQISPDARTPEAFGAIGDGVTDDTLAVQAWATFALNNNTGLLMQNRKTYLCTDSIDFGSDTSEVGLYGIDGKDSTLLFRINNLACCDFSGIQNGVFLDLKDFTIAADDGYIPLCAMLFARPKQLVGVRSSGNFIIDKVKTSGSFMNAAVYNVQSESNMFLKNQFYNNHGAAIFMTKTDYFRGTFRFPYRTLTKTIALGNTVTGQTSGATATVIRISPPALYLSNEAGEFLPNETITGSTSGSTSIVEQEAKTFNDSVDGTQRTLAYQGDIAGRFVDGETITGSTSGSTATITKRSRGEILLKGGIDDLSGNVMGNGLTFLDQERIVGTNGGAITADFGAGGYYVCNKASKFRDIEEDSTCTFQSISNTCFLVNRSEEGTFPCVAVNNWNDVIWETANLNALHTYRGILMQVFGDRVNRPQVSGTGGVTGIILRSNYLHANHWTSLYIGDNISDGTNSSMITYSDPLVAGAETWRVRCDNMNSLLFDVDIDTNGSMDWGTYRVEGTNTFKMRARNGSKQFVARAAIEGILMCQSNDDVQIIGVADSINNLTRYNLDKKQLVLKGTPDTGYLQMTGTASKSGSFGVWTGSYGVYAGQTAAVTYNSNQIQSVMNTLQTLSISYDSLFDHYKLTTGRLRAIEAALVNAGLIETL